jgi:hypothetical protein
MKPIDLSSTPRVSPSQLRRGIARRVAEAHRDLGDATLLSFVSGSVVEDLADTLSDVDMSVVLSTLPEDAALQAACARSGGSPWFWRGGERSEGSFVVAFHVDGIEVQVGYATHVSLQDDVDELLRRHNPDTPLHKLAEGIAKAEPLVDAATLGALQRRLAAFPSELRLAMARHWQQQAPTPWKAMNNIVHRDAALWCRELQVEAGYRLCGLLAAVNARWFTRFQVKRLHRFAALLRDAPPQFADRLEALLGAPPLPAARQLHALEGEVLGLVALHLPAVDLATAQARRAQFKPD